LINKEGTTGGAKPRTSQTTPGLPILKKNGRVFGYISMFLVNNGSPVITVDIAPTAGQVHVYKASIGATPNTLTVRKLGHKWKPG
jgi:hypothetical protein